MLEEPKELPKKPKKKRFKEEKNFLQVSYMQIFYP